MQIEAQSIIPRADMFHKIRHEEALRLSKTQTMLTLGFFACLGLCLPIMSLFIMRGIAVPISRLQEGMKNISDGGTETVVPVTSHDELGKLSQSFNNMASSLTKVRAELMSAYASVELKVEERTIQLSDANKELTVEITERKRAEEALIEEHRQLKQALDEVRTLRGIMPICAYCKKIRDDEGYWNQVEKYVSDHTDAKFSHGICPTCFEREMKGIEASV